MPYFFNALYLMVLLFTSPWLIYAAIRWGKYREGMGGKLWGLVPQRQRQGRCVWLHAVSVGEINLLVPLIASLERELPGCEFFISTTSKTGYELARTRYADRCVFYCPLDFSWAVRTALGRVRPSLLLLTETEIWPNMIAAAKKQGIPVAIVNGRLSDRSYRGYRRLKFLFRHVISRLDMIAVQTEAYADNFKSMGARPEIVHVTGSIKFDRAVFDRQNETTQRLAQLAGFSPTDQIFLAGSTQHPEEQFALDAFQSLAPHHPSLRLILTPRHPERFDDVAALLDRSGMRWQRRSELDGTNADSNARILLVDTIGELGAWWGTSHIAYVGGSMARRGGQNPIEPSAYGAAVSFGPKTPNFRGVVAVLLDGDAAVVVRNGEQIHEFVKKCLDDPQYAKQLGENARRIVLEQQGAVERTTELLLSLTSTKQPTTNKRLAA
jgi:3-deoxy-D-manno-octulosonic-acid transferase